MKRTTYLDSEGNVVEMPAELAGQIDKDARASLISFSRSLGLLFALGTSVNLIALFFQIVSREWLFAAIALFGILLNGFCCLTWLSLAKMKRWAYLPARIQACIFLIFLPIGTAIGWFALRRLNDAHDCFCRDEQAPGGTSV